MGKEKATCAHDPSWRCCCCRCGERPAARLAAAPASTCPSFRQRHPSRCPRRGRHTVATFSHRITAFDVSPDARTLAVATSDGVALYDLQTARRLRTVGGRENVGAVAWSGDGSRLAVGGTKDYGVPFFVGGDSTNSNKAHLTVWDTSTWEAVLEPQFGDEMVNLMFYDVAWSPDGRALAFSLDLGGVLGAGHADRRDALAPDGVLGVGDGRGLVAGRLAAGGDE